MPSSSRMRPRPALKLIKWIHTLVWAFFASAILAIPIAAYRQRFGWAFILTALVMIEVTVLTLNGMRCPLTAMAARYTEDRRSNFDIYLPEWLATYNKQIFGGLFFVGVVFALLRWTQR